MTTDILSWTSPTSWLALCAAVVMLWLGLQSLVRPASSLHRFGLTVGYHNPLVYVQYYGARNISLSLAALVFLALGMKLPIAVIAYCAALTCLLDVMILLPLASPNLCIRRASHAAVLVIFGTWMMI